MSVVLEARDLRKTYVGGDGSPIEVLAGVELSVSRGEFVAIMGASGSGKSTLLQLLGALDRPTGGEVSLGGQAYTTLTPDALATLRNRRIGFVFQFHHLLREFNARENVMMPLLIAGAGDAEAGARADALLEAVGLTARRSHLPAQLSGGEQQRAAVARALANAPDVVLADEPSGNLDHAHSENLHAIFAGLARDFSTALVVVTHNRQLAGRADRQLEMQAGRLVPVPREEGVA
jgi:lipoprotein-releasing system ATP-binding protein